MSKATRNWEKRHPEKLKAQRSRYYQKNKLKVRARAKKWVEKNPRKLLAAQLSRLYGISLEFYDAMVLVQGGRCAICAKPMDGWKEPCVDHNHKTGDVRELLCAHCNKTLGFMKESPELLERAAAYLRLHNR